jgi:hypothetical protein
MTTMSNRMALSSRATSLLRAVAIGGGLVFVAGLFFAPQRIWPSTLLGIYLVTTLALGAGALIALQYVSNAGWGAAIRRVPEGMTAVLPYCAAAMLALGFGVHSLYEWSQPAVVAGDRVLQAKEGWLNAPFFIVRIAVYFAVWIPLAWALRRQSVAQDADGNLAHTRANVRNGALYLVFVGFTLWLATVDWIMSLEPHWYSTIFGLYNYAGMMLGAVAAVAIVAIQLRRAGVLDGVLSEEHLHDLGKLVFAFATFWMYLWFSQYLLIWYADIPDEAVYFARRSTPGWTTFTLINLAFNWLIPFGILLSRRAKRNEGMLQKVCLIVLVGRWIDLSWMIQPVFQPLAPVVSIWEIGPVAGSVAGFLLVTFRTIARGNAVPVNDPYLVESLSYHS